MAERIHRLGVEKKEVPMGQLDREFHQRMILIAGNPMLERLTEGYRALGMIVRAHRHIDVVRKEHLAILDAIEAGDAQTAENLAREHVRATRQTLQQQVDSGTFEPSWVESDQ